MAFNCENVSLSLYGSEIEMVDVFKILGVFMHKNLRFTQHCKHISNKLNKFKSMFHHVRYKFPTSNKILLYNAFISSALSYCSIIYNLANKTSRLDKQLSKILFHKFELSKLNFPTFQDIIRHENINTISSILSKKSPSYFHFINANIF